MPNIPVDEVIGQLVGTGAEYRLNGPNSWLPTGGGIASLTVTRTDGGNVVVAMTFMIRRFVFEVSQQEWDRCFPPGAR